MNLVIIQILDCVTNGGKVIGAPCVFPFKYMGVTYKTCTIRDGIKPWCYTEVDSLKNGIIGKYGHCSPECLSM